MPNYELGKIYEIVGTDDNGIKLTYYGSTAQLRLCSRLSQHIRDIQNNKCSSKEVLKCKDYRINLIELFPCKCKEELKARERFYTDNNECVNKYRPIRFDNEIKLLDKEYKEQNKEIIKNQKQIYYNQNKEEITNRIKKYREQHKKEYIEYNKKHLEQNKEEYFQYRKNYRDQHKDEIKEYYEKNKDKIKEQRKNKRMQQKELKLMANEDI